MRCLRWTLRRVGARAVLAPKYALRRWTVCVVWVVRTVIQRKVCYANLQGMSRSARVRDAVGVSTQFRHNKDVFVTKEGSNHSIGHSQSATETVMNHHKDGLIRVSFAACSQRMRSTQQCWQAQVWSNVHESGSGVNTHNTVVTGLCATDRGIGTRSAAGFSSACTTTCDVLRVALVTQKAVHTRIPCSRTTKDKCIS